MRLFLILASLLMLAGCASLRPLAGHPGAEGARLAAPPARLAVLPPQGLPPASAAMLAQTLAAQLDDQTVPAEAGPAHKGDWQLVTDAPIAADGVTPRFTVIDARGKPHGAVSAAPVSPALWNAGDPATLGLIAKTMAPQIASLLSTISLAERKANPESLLNRKARIWLRPVTGAPGDGNQALFEQMTQELGALGPTIQTQEKGSDFTVDGTVDVVPGSHGIDNVTIDWKVTDKRGLAGHVTQVNGVPHGSLDHAWGSTAVYAAHEAALGLKQVIDRRIGAAVPGS